jgi:hypothetical protein
MSMTAPSDPIEVEVDNRQRISLAKVRRNKHTRYRLIENEVGEITLIPLVTIPAREMILMENPALREQLVKGILQAEHGDLVDLGSFAQYATDDDD